MKVVSIVIELEVETGDLQDHATRLSFTNGMWTCNGPTYSRINSALHEIWKLLKGVK